jgi:hypothetical protein
MKEYFSEQLKKLNGTDGILYYLTYGIIGGQTKLTCERLYSGDLENFLKSHVFFDWILLPVFIKEENVTRFT